MSNDLVKIIEDSRVEESTALTLQNSFIPFFNQANELKKQAMTITVTSVDQIDDMKKAREFRLALKELRVNADKKRKELKEDSLRYGKAVQGVYNVIEYLIVPLEKHLEGQEKFIEIQESKKREEIKNARLVELTPYSEFIPMGLDLAVMPDEDYQKILTGAKIQMQMRIDAEKKAEAERLEKEKVEAEERERIKKENEKLRAEAEEREKQLKAEREKAEKERAEKEKQLKAEQEKAMRLEREAKEKADAEAKILKEKAEAERKSKLAPDKDKLVEFSRIIDALTLPEVKSDEAKKIIGETKELLSKVSVYLVRKAGEL